MMPKIKTEFDFEKEWGVGVSPMKMEPTSPELNMHRPQERQLMRPWLWDRLEQQDVPGMFWVDKEKLQFRIPWKHGSRQGWEQNKDAVLFQMWAEHTGKFRRTDERSVRDPKTWKATFRCALNSLPDVKEVPNMSEKRGPNAYRVYQFLEPKKSRKIRKSIEGISTVKKTTRKINCYNKEFASMASPSLKRAYDFDDYGMSDDHDDGMSDTTDSGSEDFSYRQSKKIKTEQMEEKAVENQQPVSEDKSYTNNAPSFCTCGSDSHQHHPTQENDSTTKENSPATSTYSKERNRQILQMYLKSREVRKALAQTLSEQRRLALLHQKFLATKQWVQTTQQTTTSFAAFPRSNFEDDIAPINSNEDDVTSTTSSGNRTSIVSELAQKCLEEKLNSTPLPNVETLTRKNRIATCSKLTIPSIPSLRNADVLRDSTPPLTPTNSGADQVSSSSDPVSSVRSLPAVNVYSPTMSPRAHLLGSPQAKLLPPSYQPTSPTRTSLNYHAVTAAKENQVVMTPPGSTDSNPSKDADRDTASPYSDLSDESVISMVDDMMTMTTTTVQTTVTAAPVDYVAHNPIETPSFCQLFSSSSQLLLANGYSQA